MTKTYKILISPFLIGLISAQKIQFIGELYVGEAIGILYCLFNISKLKFSAVEIKITIFALIWAGAQLVSDLFNSTPVEDAAKGILAPVVFASTFIFLVNYFKNKSKHLPSLILGASLGWILNKFAFPSDYFIFNPWKWGLGASILSLFVIYYSFFYRKKSLIVLFVFFIFFFFISLYFDGRSIAIFPLISALLYIFCYNKKSYIIRFVSGNWSNLKVIIIALPTLLIINFLSSALFSSETVLSNFSSESAAKYRIQASGSYGILLGGRSEVLISGEAFLDRPLLGHGSWAIDKTGYLDKYTILRQKLGYSLREDGGYESTGNHNLIPAHSFLMGAFVWAGFLGGLFWIITLNETLSVFLKNIATLPLYYHVGIISFLWNVFFSPFGSDARWSTALFLSALFSFAALNKDKTKVS